VLTTGNKPGAWPLGAAKSCRHVDWRDRRLRLCVLVCLAAIVSAIGLLVYLVSPESTVLAQAATYTLQQTVQPTLPPRPTLEPTMPPRPTPGSTLAPRPTLVPTVITRPTLAPPKPTDGSRPAPPPREAQPTPIPTPAVLPVTGGSRPSSMLIGLISVCGVLAIGASLVLRRKAR
jgi:hypothetical protein